MPQDKNLEKMPYIVPLRLIRKNTWEIDKNRAGVEVLYYAGNMKTDRNILDVGEYYTSIQRLYLPQQQRDLSNPGQIFFDEKSEDIIVYSGFYSVEIYDTFIQ